MTFTPDNWDTSQDVMITGVDDEQIDGDIEYQIRLAPSGSSDSEYQTMEIYSVQVLNKDNETKIITWFVFVPGIIK